MGATCPACGCTHAPGIATHAVRAALIEDDLDRALAHQLARSAPVAMRYIINAVNKGSEMPFAEASQYEATLFGLVASTDDMREGTAAFLERRKPAFVGR